MSQEFNAAAFSIVSVRPYPPEADAVETVQAAVAIKDINDGMRRSRLGGCARHFIANIRQYGLKADSLKAVLSAYVSAGYSAEVLSSKSDSRIQCLELSW